MAIDKNNVPLNVMARSIILLLVKQDSPETQFPKIVTSKKKTTMSVILMITTFPIATMILFKLYILDQY